MDRDGLPELQVRFRFDAVAPHLSVGVNLATIVGRAGGSEVQGTGTIEVLALATDLLGDAPHAPEALLRGGRAGADHLRRGALRLEGVRSARSGSTVSCP